MVPSTSFALSSPSPLLHFDFLILPLSSCAPLTDYVGGIVFLTPSSFTNGLWDVSPSFALPRCCLLISGDSRRWDELCRQLLRWPRPSAPWSRQQTPRTVMTTEQMMMIALRQKTPHSSSSSQFLRCFRGSCLPFL